jgi:hypothetical protein
MGAKPCTEATEKLVINALLTKIAEKHNASIDCDPSTNRTVIPTNSPKECSDLVIQKRFTDT